MKLFTTLFLSIYCLQLFGQGPGQGRRTLPADAVISGVVYDDNTRKPIDFATISLQHLRDSNFITGGLAGENGSFKISELKYGPYELVISFIGYEDFVQKPLVIKPNQKHVVLPTVFLKPSKSDIGIVDVTAEKRIIEVGIDKKTYNVEKDITASTGSALEVLENVPSVTVDQNGTISLRGNTNVRILIDGRPANVIGDVSAYLQGLPGNAIESVDIITNPSAKYDPEGMAGILNIKMKKGKAQGLNGSVNLSADQRGSTGAGINLNYRTEYFNLFGGYSFRRSIRNRVSGNNFDYHYPDSTYFLDQEGTSNSTNMGHFANLGVDVFINKYHKFGISGMIDRSDDYGEEVEAYQFFDELGSSFLAYDRETVEDDSRKGNSATFYYAIDFPEKDHNLNFDFSYSDREDLRYDTYQNVYAANDIRDLQVLDRPTLSERFSGQVDYVYPEDNGGQFETGYKFELNSRTQETYGESADEFGIWTPDSISNNRFTFEEQIQSVYGIYSRDFPRWGFLAGMRLEQAQTTSYLENTNETFENPYVSVFPSAHILYKFSKTNRLQLSYSKRVNRPRGRQLNPFTDYSNPSNLRTGNPFLKPEYSHSVELSHSRFFKKGSLLSSIYYRHTVDVIRRFKVAREEIGVSEVTFLNFDNSQNYGLELIGTYRPGNRFNALTTVHLFQTIIDGDNVESELHSEGFSWNCNITANWTFYKKMSLQLRGSYRAPFTIPQGEIQEVVGLDAGLRVPVLKGKGDLSFSGFDILNSRKFRGYVETPVLDQEFLFQWHVQTFSMGFTYRFGKRDTKGSERKRRRGNNEPGGGGSPDIF